MVHLYVDSALAGLIATNGVPHYIKGMLGKKHMLPFGRSSSAVVNVVWGWVCLAAGGVLLYYAHPRSHYLRAGATFAVASLVMALVLSVAGSSKKAKA